jgi:small ligand-binding sensory domain FIST
MSPAEPLSPGEREAIGAAQFFGAALSEHPIAAHATGEVVGELLEQVGEAPDLAVLFATRPHVGALEDVARAVRATLRPGALIGATAVSVMGGAREVEEHSGLAMWAARVGPVHTVAIDAVEGVAGWTFTGLSPSVAARARTLVLLADPTTFPVDVFLTDVARQHPDLQVIGGMASAGFGPGANRLVLDDKLRQSGAVGVLLTEDQAVTTVVSQGCRPIGDPFTVTKAERNVIYEIGGRPALDRLQELLGGLDEQELAMARDGLHLGRVIDEHKPEFGRGDFLIRNVLGGDRDVGAIAVGDDVAIGDTVQFQVRDADSADEDLRLLLDGHTADGALVFTCNGRGTRLFGRPDHDAEIVVQSIESSSVAGMFCAGEIGPVGTRSFLHGFTASIALFTHRSDRSRAVGSRA